MADIPHSTNDVTIYDETDTNPVEVSQNANSGIYELRTKDQDVYDILSASGSVSKTKWQSLCENGKGFSATTATVTISGTAETDFILLRNPSGSTITIKLDTLYYFNAKGNGILRVYQAPTITTVGTAMTINKMLLDGATNPQALCYYAPTISARGTLRRVLGTTAYNPLITDYELTLLIPPDYDMLFTIQPTSNNTDHVLGATWGEE